MTSPKRPGRKLLFVSDNVHALVNRIKARRGETQSQTIKAGMEALQREMEAGK